MATADSTPFKVHSDKVTYTDSHIVSQYSYSGTRVTREADALKVVPVAHDFTFRTGLRVPKLGLMIVGWGGNNGTTLTGGILANKNHIGYRTVKGPQEPDYYGSFLMSSTVRLGLTEDGEEIYVPFRDLLPTVHPNDIVIDGWDISAMNLAEAAQRAEVLPWDLQEKLAPMLSKMKPRPSIYIPDFIAANQETRADNVLKGTKAELVEKIRADIRDFKQTSGVDKVIVLWSANTERFSDIVPGKNDTADNLLQAIKEEFSEVSPSTLFAVACIQEGVPYINGSPQNTFVPGVVELAERFKTPIAGDDFKTGQTKFKSVLVDFLISSGIKPTSIVSYNHLGNNDGKNLSAPQQFRSKEISKSNVVDDMVASNKILYKEGEHPDHVVVIKYVPYVGDSKRALDEYTSKIFMGGTNTIVVHNTCEDSLLAAPVMLDLVLLMELGTRIEYKTSLTADWEHFHPVMSLLSFLLKAPQVPPGTPVVNALFKQRAAIENILRACLGLQPEHNMGLEYKARVEGVAWKRPETLHAGSAAGTASR